MTTKTQKKPLLDHPFDKLTEGQLRRGIIEKFGSIARFAEISGVNKWTIYKAFNRKRDQVSQSRRLNIYIEARGTQNATITGAELSREKKNEIRMAIISHPDSLRGGRQSMKNFCDKHGINTSWLSKVLSSREYGKQLTNGSEFKRVLSILKFKL